MLRYIYTAKYPSAPNSSEDDGHDSGNPWARHLELAIVADKYGITALRESALQRLDGGWRLETASDVAEFARRARDLAIEQERLDAIVLQACSGCFVDCFELPGFRDWLDERPQMRDDLCANNIHALMKNQTFQDRLETSQVWPPRCLNLSSSRILRICKPVRGAVH